MLKCSNVGSLKLIYKFRIVLEFYLAEKKSGFNFLNYLKNILETWAV